MKALKSITATAILALALSVPAHAGEVQTPGYTPPPPPPPSIIIVDRSTTPIVAPSYYPEVVNILWLLASIF